MLQQTQVTTVIPYYTRWLKKLPTWQDLAQADEHLVLKLWEGLGYYSRARNLQKLAQAVCELPQQELPSDIHQLRKLPGIGPYTAGAIASICFAQSVPLVDGNVERVFARVFNYNGNLRDTATKKWMWEVAEHLVPAPDSNTDSHINPGDFNQSLMELGATICTPRKPQCLLCPLQPVCKAPEPERLPVKNKAESIQQKETLSLVFKTKNRKQILLRKPGKLNKSDRWPQFHRLPHYDKEAMTQTSEGIKHTHRYTITKYRVTAEVIEGALKQRTLPEHNEWIDVSHLREIALPAPHRKILSAIL